MARIETWYKQDLKRPLVVHKHTDVFNQDSKGNLIGVEVYSDGEPVALSGSISGYCLLADGTTVPAVGASRSGNKASVLIPQTAYSVPGPITITIKNVEGDNITTLCATVGVVRQSVSGNIVNPGSVVTDWSNNINAQLQAVQTAVDNVGAIVAAPFDENTVYVVGNYVTNNGNLYRITADHAAGVAWSGTTKVQCTVGHELEALNKHFIANWNLIDPDAASGNETGFIPVELNVRYNIIHAQSKGQFQYGLSLYDSDKTMLYISQLVDEATDGTNYSYSCTFSQSAIAYVKIKINSAPSGIDTTDFSKVYFGKGSEYIEFADYNVIHAIKKVKDDVSDLADEISDLNSALGTVPSGKTAQGQIDDNANDISDLKSALTHLDQTIFGIYPIVTFETEVGNIDNSGVPSDSNLKYLRSVDYTAYDGDKWRVVVEEGYSFTVYFYNSSKVYQTKAIIHDYDSPFVIEQNPEDYPYIKVKYKKNDGSAADNDWKNHITVYNITESTAGFKKETEDRLDALEPDVSEMKPYVDLLHTSDTTYTTGTESGYYRVINNEIEKKTGNYTRLKIQADQSMLSVSYTILSLISSTAVYCAFTDATDTLIQNYNDVGVNDIPIPQNAKYIYLSFFGSGYNSSYTIKKLKYVTNEELGIYDNQYYGKNAVAFGTSLTYRAQTTGGYLQYLPQMSGMTIDNQGVGSSKIYGNSETSILNKILTYNGFSDVDVVLIEGFVNDWYNNSPLGDIYDTDVTTVCGCLYKAINHILSIKDSITIIVILDHFGINADGVDMSPSVTKNVGKQYDYYEKLATVCAIYGIPCIKEYKTARMNQWTDRYYLDYIHLNPIGAKQAANIIWSEMKQIPLSVQ